MPQRRPGSGCPHCRDLRRAHAALDARLLAAKTRLLNQLEAMEGGAPQPAPPAPTGYPSWP